MKKIYNVCLFVATLFASTQTLKAQFAESGNSVAEENGTYYVLYETGEQSEQSIGVFGEKPYTLKGPGTQLIFDAKRQSASQGNLQVIEGGTETVLFNEKLSTNWETKTVSLSSHEVESFKFYGAVGVTLSKYFKNVKVTMAQYLEGAPESVTIPEGKVGVAASTSFDFKWCNLGDIAISSDNPMFTVSKEVEPATQGKWGKTSITVTCANTSAGTHTGVITITGAGKTIQVNVNSTVTKNKATITWNIPENLAIDEVVENAASQGKAPVELSLTSSNESILKVDGTKVTAVGVGSAELTATITETANYYGVTETRTINVADKERQTITWEQNLAVIPTTTATVELTATTNSGLPLAYTSSNPAVATVEGNILTILSVGRTDIKVSVEGNDTYFPAYLTKSVVVYDPNAACPDILLAGGEFELHQNLTGDGTGQQSYTWDATKPAGELIFDVIGEIAWPFGSEDITISIDVYRNGSDSKENDWKTITVSTQVSGHHTITLDEDISGVNFRLDYMAGRNRTVKFTNVEVYQAEYIRPSVTGFTFNPLNLNAIDTKEITLHFSALASMCTVGLEQDDKVFSLEEGVTFGEGCGSVGTKTFTLTFSSQGLTAEDCATYENAITIINSQGEEEMRIPVSGTVEQLRQTIDWTPATTELNLTDEVLLPTKSSGDVEVVYTSSNEEIATVAEGKLLLHAFGTVTITADAPANDIYQAAPAVAHTFTIHSLPYTAMVDPVTTVLEFGEALSTLTLTGTATDEAGNIIAGTFAFAHPEETPASGTAAHDVIFTPENKNHYDTVVVQVEVTVNVQPQTIPWEMESTSINVLANITVPSSTTGGVAIVYTSSNEDVAYVDAAYNLVIRSAGEVTITATAEGNELYAPAEPVVKQITINKVVYDILIDEPIKGLELGQPLSSLTLLGRALDEYANEVAGVLAFADPYFIPTETGITEQDLIFTPDNLGYYEILVKTVQVYVAEPTGGSTTDLQDATNAMLVVVAQPNGFTLLSATAQPVAVYNVAGTLVYSSTLSANVGLFVPAETGLYVVRTANAAQKVSVR